VLRRSARRALDWLDDRTGYRRLLSVALDEPIAGGPSWVYVFGSVLTFILLNQIITGILLAMYYSPSAQTAWASVAYVQDQVTMGWFIRGLHSKGASAMVIVAGLHILQTATYGAYKKPREVNWLLGTVMLGLIMAFALTGYLLPWDQKGYWATKVATGIMGRTPLIGSWLQEVVQGGNQYGNLTLTRFYAIHTFLLPATLVTLVAAHIALFRRHGVTTRWSRSAAELSRSRPFWPGQAAWDGAAMLLALGILIAVTVSQHGAELAAPADPASAYDARPEWYFLPLFQLLKYFSGTMERVVALGAPAVLFGIFFALPFVDRGSARSPFRRLPYLVPLGGLGAGAALLIGLAVAADSGDAALQKRLVAADKQAHKARRLALQGVPPPGGTAVYENEPFYRAKKLFAERCQGCHVGNERKGPELGPGYNSRPWLRAYLLEPDGDRFFGVTKRIHEMKPVKLRGEDLTDVIEALYAETGAKDADRARVERGRKLITEGKCADCHELEPTEEGDTGPNLAGRGTVEYLTEFIAEPGKPRFFGKRNEMPTFRNKLRADEISALAAYVASLRDASASVSEEDP